MFEILIRKPKIIDNDLEKFRLVLLQVLNSYKSHNYKNIKETKIEELLRLIEEPVPKIIETLKKIPPRVLELNKKLKELLIIEKRTAKDFPINENYKKQLDNSIKELTYQINLNIEETNNLCKPLRQISENIKDLLIENINNTINLLEQATSLNNEKLIEAMIIITKELEQEKNQISTIIKLIDEILYNYTKRLTERENPENYEVEIISECKKREMLYRFRLLRTNIKEKLLDKEIKKEILITRKHIKKLLDNLEHFWIKTSLRN